MLTSLKATGILAGTIIVAGLYFGWIDIQTSHAQDNIKKIVKVSGDDPYADCETPPTTGEINFPNTRVEPYVAANLASHNLIGIWQQDRWEFGGARGLVAAFSSDSGKSWGQTALPFSQCAPAGLAEERASDPWVSIGPDGTAYASAISFSFDSATPDTSVVVVTSMDGGKTWLNLNVIKRDLMALAFNDKEAVTADPTIPGTAYVVWDRGGFGQGTSAWFAETRNAGVTWSSARNIHNTVHGEFTGGHQIVVDPNTHVLYDFFGWTPPNSPADFAAFMKSTDGGATWSSPQKIAEMMSVPVIGANAQQLIRTHDNDRAQILAMLRARGVNVLSESVPVRAGFRAVAIDPRAGQLYVVWEDARFSNMSYDEVAISTSTDGGATWSAPSRVNTPTGRVKFTPSVQVNREGVVAVTYYDFRNFRGQQDTLPTDYWITFSKNGGTSFEDEDHLAGSFNMLAAPFLDGDGFFLGDYAGLGAIGNAFLPFFVQTNCLDNSCAAITGGSRPTDVYTTRIEP
jgi:hypothetical protein